MISLPHTHRRCAPRWNLSKYLGCPRWHIEECLKALQAYKGTSCPTRSAYWGEDNPIKQPHANSWVAFILHKYSHKFYPLTFFENAIHAGSLVNISEHQQTCLCLSTSSEPESIKLDEMFFCAREPASQRTLESPKRNHLWNANKMLRPVMMFLGMVAGECSVCLPT